LVLIEDHDAKWRGFDQLFEGDESLSASVSCFGALGQLDDRQGCRGALALVRVTKPLEGQLAAVDCASARGRRQQFVSNAGNGLPAKLRDVPADEAGEIRVAGANNRSW